MHSGLTVHVDLLAYHPMKLRVFTMAALAALMMVGSGCYSSLDGRMKAGFPVKDTIVARYERPVEQIFQAAKQVLQYNGTLTSENTITKTLEAKIDTRTVWVKVDLVEPSISRVQVQARLKGGGADLDLASEIDKQIALQL